MLVQEYSCVYQQNMAQIIVAKHRNGPLGSVDLRFDPERVSFKNVDKRFESVPAEASI